MPLKQEKARQTKTEIAITVVFQILDKRWIRKLERVIFHMVVAN